MRYRISVFFSQLALVALTGIMGTLSGALAGPSAEKVRIPSTKADVLPSDKEASYRLDDAGQTHWIKIEQADSADQRTSLLACIHFQSASGKMVWSTVGDSRAISQGSKMQGWRLGYYQTPYDERWFILTQSDPENKTLAHWELTHDQNVVVWRQDSGSHEWVLTEAGKPGEPRVMPQYVPYQSFGGPVSC